MTSVGVMASSVSSGGPYGDVLAEPFNNFTTNSWAVVGSPTIVSGRTGNAASLVGVTPTITYTIPSVSESDTLTVGCAFRINSLASTFTLWEFYSDTAVTLHSKVRVLNNGGLDFSRNVTIIGASATGLIAINTWYYLEAQMKLHDTAGAFEVRLNGTAVIGPSTSQDTKNAGTKTTYDSWRLRSITSNTTLFDDLYLSVGGVPFKGDHTIP